jgi:hypothetical protein
MKFDRQDKKMLSIFILTTIILSGLYYLLFDLADDLPIKLKSIATYGLILSGFCISFIIFYTGGFFVYLKIKGA